MRNLEVYVFIRYFFPGVILSHGQTSLAQEPKVDDSTLPSLGKEVEDNSRYKTLNANATLLKLLVDDKDGVSR